MEIIHFVFLQVHTLRCVSINISLYTPQMCTNLQGNNRNRLMYYAAMEVIYLQINFVEYFIWFAHNSLFRCTFEPWDMDRLMPCYALGWLYLLVTAIFLFKWCHAYTYIPKNCSTQLALDHLCDCSLPVKTSCIMLVQLNGTTLQQHYSEFPEQRASYAENVSIWWRHHALTMKTPCIMWVQLKGTTLQQIEQESVHISWDALYLGTIFAWTHDCEYLWHIHSPIIENLTWTLIIICNI